MNKQCTNSFQFKVFTDFLSESLTFFLGLLIDITAVKAFSLYAGVAVLINFGLQVTAFVSLLTLDAKRSEKNRVDCLPCIKLKSYEPYSDSLIPLIARKKNKGMLR